VAVPPTGDCLPLVLARVGAGLKIGFPSRNSSHQRHSCVPALAARLRHAHSLAPAAPEPGRPRALRPHPARASPASAPARAAHICAAAWSRMRCLPLGAARARAPAHGRASPAGLRPVQLPRAPPKPRALLRPPEPPSARYRAALAPALAPPARRAPASASRPVRAEPQPPARPHNSATGRSRMRACAAPSQAAATRCACSRAAPAPPAARAEPLPHLPSPWARPAACLGRRRRERGGGDKDGAERGATGGERKRRGAREKKQRRRRNRIPPRTYAHFLKTTGTYL
jgi:hypothetical protein